ncbi:hypothetical protein [Francisella philomiragia]|uniref:hypothetical protein n=1 Tax=Francisella philomiragia TaxID=28110 RepID=UPI001C9DBE79|nr:hypothetical protein [Francisella philomiragia]MBY7735085.1 hypothetical protein [Francisella philomiragia]
MSRKLKVLFNSLAILIMLFLMIGFIATLSAIKSFGLIQGFLLFGAIYDIILIILIVFLFKKNIKALYLAFILTLYSLITSSIAFDFDKGLFGSIKMIFNYLSNGFYQAFCMTILSWIIPIVAGIGIIFYLIDQNKNSPKD